MRGASLFQCARAISYLSEPLTTQDRVQVLLLFVLRFVCLPSSKFYFIQLVVFDHDIESFDGTTDWQKCTKGVKTKMTSS